jgi:hypothetical protein
LQLCDQIGLLQQICACLLGAVPPFPQQIRLAIKILVNMPCLRLKCFEALAIIGSALAAMFLAIAAAQVLPPPSSL